MVAVKVATKNAPRRGGEANNARDFQRLADRRVSVLAAQEIPDSAVKRLTPQGWRRHRPSKARSEVIYWDPTVWECLGRGAFPISSDKAPADRYIVWVLLRHRKTGIVRRFGCAHFVAFKTRNKAHAAEYRHQEARAAEWLARSDNRVLMGDLNGSLDGAWMRELKKVANDQTPPTKSGPNGQNIDLILTPKGSPRAIRAEALAGFHGDHKPVEAMLPLR